MQFYGQEITSRMLIGSSLYPSPAIMQEAIRASGAEIVTVSVRRESAGLRAGQSFWQFLRELDLHLLPNTAGCKTVREAVTTAQMARELFETNWLKLEVIGDDDSLQPDVVATIEAAAELTALGFQVFPYCTEDVTVAARLLDAGCEILMPWGSPIGSGKGLLNRYGLRGLRARFPGVPMIIDAGLGAPSQAAEAMEMGFDAILLNTAIAKAGDPVAMAGAFSQALHAGHQARSAGIMEPREMAIPSTPIVGQPFWHTDET